MDISVLVVDGEETLRDLLVKILSREGYVADMAVDGQEAVEKLRLREYDLLISDIKMPRLDGLELLKLVKAEYPKMGVIMIIAQGDSYSIKEVLTLGADEYITKPFKSFEVNLIVERAYWRNLSSREDAS